MPTKPTATKKLTQAEIASFRKEVERLRAMLTTEKTYLAETGARIKTLVQLAATAKR